MNDEIDGPAILKSAGIDTYGLDWWLGSGMSQRGDQSGEWVLSRDTARALAEAERRGYERCQRDVVARLNAKAEVYAAREEDRNAELTWAAARIIERGEHVGAAGKGGADTYEIDYGLPWETEGFPGHRKDDDGERQRTSDYEGSSLGGDRVPGGADHHDRTGGDRESMLSTDARKAGADERTRDIVAFVRGLSELEYVGSCESFAEAIERKFREGGDDGP